MKIYSNPNFPRFRPEHAAQRERIDTATFLAELQERNAKSLEYLRAHGLRGTKDGPPKPNTERERSASYRHTHQATGRTLKGGTHNHRFSGLTGPPIEVPGGHVHAIQGTTEFGRKRSE